VTGELHVGHALTATIQDVLVRYHRLRGDPTLFLPGVDHAGIAIQYVLEKELKKEGKTRFDLGREKFVERIWQWIEKYGEKIDHQHRRLGVSVDWTRRRFTMDKDYQESVKVAFQKLYDEGLIFRGERIVNWCPRCQTAISDLENVHQEEKGRLYFLDYKTIQIATTRPETIFADVAIAVNPKDKRYRSLIGQKASIPLTKRRIPIIADELVDLEFGTGALKITPAHDELDWQIWQKHKGKIPEFPTVITTDGHLAKGNKYVPAKYWGSATDVARKSVLEDLKKSKMLTREEKIKHSVGHCQRCDTVTEPQVSKQWFVKMKPLAKEAIGKRGNGCSKKWENKNYSETI
ncbi:class I tRNA ligase family protein, partial [Candidatus Curtissbacteria bacterium]|nr:class I tRNA ligase family protein [Candidatus Curtissbacteria bacterium]